MYAFTYSTDRFQLILVLSTVSITNSDNIISFTEMWGRMLNFKNPCTSQVLCEKAISLTLLHHFQAPEQKRPWAKELHRP